jgi:acrylyl-CoA reductase (NADPH)
MDSFTALVLEQRDGATHSTIQQLPADVLPEGDVLIQVAYSDLNYKDGLAITGRGKVVRKFPMVPGIDLAGTVVESAAPEYKPGDQVVVTGWGLGEVHWGGMAQLARVKSGWLVPLPQGLSLKQAMGIGTAGFTAMQCVLALEEHGMRPSEREVLVTGASGGVGSIAVAALAKLGYHVVASTGKVDEHDYLRSLGARQVIGRIAPSGKPLESERWGGAVDTVGGATLAAIFPALASNCAVAAVGNAGGAELNTTVFPFILRGVGLLGVVSVLVPFERRQQIWARLVHDLPANLLDGMIQVAPLAEAPALSQAICEGQLRGRQVIDVNA